MSILLIHPDLQKFQAELGHALPDVHVEIIEPHSRSEVVAPLPTFSEPLDLSRRALIIYTSGTTAGPKGCVSTHSNINFQCSSLISAWKYTDDDHIIHVLPLHHVHGIINGLTAMLLAGGTVEMYQKFDPRVVWRRWSEGGTTMFMAVPTVYTRLISYYKETLVNTLEVGAAVDGVRKLRLVVSGSAALPTSVKEQFKEITGQVLLERYGMTEIGMALSCRYDNTDGKGRIDGSVGWPLDGVEVRLVTQDHKTVTAADEQGEIQIRGPNVFKEYVEPRPGGES